MAGNHNSGRRRQFERSYKSKELYAEYAIGRIAEMSKDTDIPSSVRLEANKYLCDREWGKPHQSTDIVADISSTPIGEIHHHLDFGDNEHDREESNAINRESEAGSPAQEAAEAPATE